MVEECTIDVGFHSNLARIDKVDTRKLLKDRRLLTESRSTQPTPLPMGAIR